MNLIVLLTTPWLDAVALPLLLGGLALVWRGLVGGGDGAALLGRRISMVRRMKGFRLTVFGLVLIGLGTAVIADAPWLLVLALGIGFVEILESSTLIAVWQWADQRR